MKSRSIYFLQTLWDVEVQRKDLLQIAKKAMMHDVEKTLCGVLNQHTIWLSSEACTLQSRIETIKKRIEAIEKPYDLLDINDKFIDATGKIRALQIKTIQTLDADSGLIMKDMHIVVRQLFPYVLRRIKEQMSYQIYRLLVLGCELPEQALCIPKDEELQMVLNYYLTRITPLLDTLSDSELDGRWAYERRRVCLNGELVIEQFVSVTPLDEEIKQPLGIPSIGTGANGEFRIFGRGKMTNLLPKDISEKIVIQICRKIPDINKFSFITNENCNPLIILNRIFEKRKYLVSPQDYFELINRSIIANTFYHRVKTGNCIYCGSPLYINKCSKCGRVWKL